MQFQQLDLQPLTGYMGTLKTKVSDLKASSMTTGDHMKEVDDLLRMVGDYSEGKPVWGKLNTIKFRKAGESIYRRTAKYATRLYGAAKAETVLFF